MPQIFKLGSYWVYLWTNENKPLEPIHVHISEGALLRILQKYGLHNRVIVCSATIIQGFLSVVFAT